MGEFSDKSMEFITRKLPGAMEALGIRAVGAITQELDTPYPPASVPGESPHKRTGNLQAGVSHAESIEGTDYVCTVSSRRAKATSDDGDNVPIVLEEYLNRPFMRPVMNQASAMIPMSMRRSFDGGVPDYESAD